MFNSLEVEFGRIFSSWNQLTSDFGWRTSVILILCASVMFEQAWNLTAVHNMLRSCEFGYIDVFRVMTVQPQSIF